MPNNVNYTTSLKKKLQLTLQKRRVGERCTNLTEYHRKDTLTHFYIKTAVVRA